MEAEGTIREAQDTVKIDARGLHYRVLNEQLHQLVESGCRDIELVNVNGQRYIGTGLRGNPRIRIFGTPGADLAAFMSGPDIEVRGSAQDAAANTMNAGRLVIHGNTGNVLGLAMRGGTILVRGSVGYRVGIHIKAFRERVPVIAIGGNAGHFLGEYMAGGRIIVLGLGSGPGQPLAGDYLGTGMHGGTIYLRGEVDESRLGKEVQQLPMEDADIQTLRGDLEPFCQAFGLDLEEILASPFSRLECVTSRPYGQLYVY